MPAGRYDLRLSLAHPESVRPIGLVEPAGAGVEVIGAADAGVAVGCAAGWAVGSGAVGACAAVETFAGLRYFNSSESEGRIRVVFSSTKVSYDWSVRRKR